MTREKLKDWLELIGIIAIGFLWAVVATVVAYPERALARQMLIIDLAVFLFLRPKKLMHF